MIDISGGNKDANHDLVLRRLEILSSIKDVDRELRAMKDAKKGLIYDSGNKYVNSLNLSFLKRKEKISGESEIIRECLVKEGVMLENGQFVRANTVKEKKELAIKAQNCYDRAKEAGEYRNILNEHLENGAYHHLYGLEKNTNKYTKTFTFKSVQQKQAIELWSNYTLLSKENISMWIYNGITRENIKITGDAKSYKDAIETLRKAGKEEINGVFLAALPALIKAIAAAAATILLALSQMKAAEKAQFTSSLSAYGTETFGPQTSDFEEIEENEGNDYMTLLLFGAGALLLNKQ